MPPLTEEKAAKIKKFTKEFAHRVLKKLRRAAKAATNGDGPSSTAADEALSREVAAEMAAEDPEDDDEDEGEDGEDDAGGEAEGEASVAKMSRLESGLPSPRATPGEPLSTPAAPTPVVTGGLPWHN